MSYKMKKSKWACSLIFILLCILCTTAIAETYYYAKLSPGYVYERPLINGARKAKVGACQVQVLGFNGPLVKIRNKSGITAYTLKSRVRPYTKVGYTQTSTSVYSEPSTSSAAVTVPRGYKVIVGGEANGLYIIKNSKGNIGYIQKNVLGARKPSSSAPSTGSSLDKYIGLPYSQYECGAFVALIMHDFFHVNIPHTSASIAKDTTHFINLEKTAALRPGDVLVFDTSDDGTIDHVAVFVKGSTFIEASQKLGYSHFNTLTSWYKEHLLFIKRLK